MTQALLTRIAGGDMTAVGLFVRHHTPLVWGQARRFCRNAEDAEDAVQDIFLEIWRNAGRYDAQQGSEIMFIATIARRRLVDRLRRKAGRPPAARLDDPSAVQARIETDTVELREEATRARDAMRQLRPEQRDVLELALGHGQSHQEIAATVGIPLGTVKSHARRGLMRLREMLGVQPAGVDSSQGGGGP